MMQWPEYARVDLWPQLRLVHQGEPRQSWFGLDPRNAKKMKALFSLGLYEAWKLRAGHIRVPQPKELTISNAGRSTDDIVEILSRYNDVDPFKYKVTVE